MSSKTIPPIGVRPVLPKSAGEKKAAETNASARRIIDSETESRDAKSARLKKARLAQEAKNREDQSAVPPKTRRKAAPKAKKQS